MNYNNKIFKAISNSDNGEVGSEIRFHYKQEGNILSCYYAGDEIVKGQLIGLVDEEGNINMRYQQINKKGELMTGICSSKPKIENGKLYLYETWQWTSGDKSKGHSVLEDVTDVDKRKRLEEDPFSFKFTKENKLIISRANKQIKIITGKHSTRFRKLSESASEEEIQLALAKLTGNYKRGNEKNK